MKQLIPTYTFVAAAKTIQLTDFATVRLDRLLLVVNVTRNVIYYNFADASLGATVATNVITLVGASTAGHADADKIEVFYDTVANDPEYLLAQLGNGVTLQAAAGALGNGTILPVGGCAAAMLSVAITATATVTVEATEDGTNWAGIDAERLDNGIVTSGGGIPNIGSTPVKYLIRTAGLVSIRARVSAFTSGTVTVTGHAFNTAPHAIPTPLISGTAMNVSGSRTINSAFVALSPQWLKELNDASGTFVAARANQSIILLASAGRTTTQTGADITNYNARMLRVILDVTVNTIGSVTLSVQGKDANGVYHTLLTGVAIVTTGTSVYKIFPEAVAAANAIAQDFLPKTFRIVVTANNANSVTYSVAYDMNP